ncbi:Rna demethylase alkbh9b [Thalictrum thalictroides]|uniref:Rna demethylase alkbh9b n=1 Tax=Thalictrum thalictroides TaxID=46969 RepID=A0A7J6XBL3_THATH|nr:Rna demethylase alkbh9b [Thalictrum thalictroides]
MSNLSDLLPYLSEGFCSTCKGLLESRLRNFNQSSSNGKFGGNSLPDGYKSDSSTESCLSTGSSCFSTPDNRAISPVQTTSSTPASVKSNGYSVGHPVSTQSTDSRIQNKEFGNKLSVNAGNGRVVPNEKNVSLTDKEQIIRMSKVGRKKDFVCKETIKGRQINVLEGLELHTRVFDEKEQKQIVDFVYALQRMGRSRELRERTYSEPRKWMRGKGRVTMQFGCCYNYAVDKKGNPPGIMRDEEVDPIPTLFKSMIKKMVRWSILPPSCIPNSCIVNIYDEGDCIPPHIDHHDFLRPFCTVSFLTESSILFGSNLKTVAPGEFSGSASIPLPVGSVLVLKGNGADVAKHCVPAVHGKRISITFRKMDDSKLPFKFSLDPELLGILPLGSSLVNKLPVPQVAQLQNLQRHSVPSHNNSELVKKTSGNPIQFGEVDFPPLGASNTVSRAKSKK